VTAPLVLATLLRRPDFAASKSFVAWNVSGILELTVAVSIGALVPLLAPNFYGVVSTDRSYVTAAAGADSNMQISNALITQKSQTCAEVRLGRRNTFCHCPAASASRRAVGSRADDGQSEAINQPEAINHVMPIMR
jgi:hypothetical protein